MKTPFPKETKENIRTDIITICHFVQMEFNYYRYILMILLKETEFESFSCASLVTQTVKNLPAMQETQARSLGWEDTLEKGMDTHSSILAWEIPWTEEPGSLHSIGSRRAGHD